MDFITHSKCLITTTNPTKESQSGWFPSLRKITAAASLTARLSVEPRSSNSTVKEGGHTFYVQVQNHAMEGHEKNHIIAVEEKEIVRFTSLTNMSPIQ